MRRMTLIVLICTFAACGVLLRAASGLNAVKRYVITSMKGTCELRMQGGWSALSVGDSLGLKDVIRSSREDVAEVYLREMNAANLYTITIYKDEFNLERLVTEEGGIAGRDGLASFSNFVRNVVRESRNPQIKVSRNKGGVVYRSDSSTLEQKADMARILYGTLAAKCGGNLDVVALSNDCVSSDIPVGFAQVGDSLKVCNWSSDTLYVSIYGSAKGIKEELPVPVLREKSIVVPPMTESMLAAPNKLKGLINVFMIALKQEMNPMNFVKTAYQYLKSDAPKVEAMEVGVAGLGR